jgi:hypothetical protein
LEKTFSLNIWGMDCGLTTHKSGSELIALKELRGDKKVLSRDCDGCSQMKACCKRYSKVGKGEKVYCPDGTAHLVDEDAEFQVVLLDEQCVRQNR